MVWIGILVGIGLGIACGSLPVGLCLAILGGAIGLWLSLRTAKYGGATSRGALSLPAQVSVLQTQVRSLTERLTQLEQSVAGDAAVTAAIPVMGGQLPVSETFASAPVVRTATAPTVDSPQASLPTALVEQPIGQIQSPPRAMSIQESIPEPIPEVKSEANSEPIHEPITAQTPEPIPARVLKPVPKPLREPGALQLFFRRWIIGGNPLVKIGVLILFLGLGFLLRYAAEHAVLPVEVRYAGVAVTGIVLLLCGWRWRLKKDNYGLILQGSGIAVLYLTTLAAMRLHPLIPLQFGFGILICVAAFAALLAVLQDSLALALVASIGGFAAPVLASSGSTNQLALFSYLTLLNLGIVAIAWYKAWRPLNLVGFGGTLLLAGAWAHKYYQPVLFAHVEPFLLLWFALYVLVTFLFARRTLAQGEQGIDAIASQFARVGYVDGSLATGVPTITFGLQLLLVRPWEYGAAFSALGYGLFYIVTGFLLFRGAPARYRLLSETMLALAVVFGSLAIPLGMDTRMTAAAWAVEAAGIFWLGARQQRPHARWFALLLLGGSTIAFLLDLHSATATAAIDGAPLGAILLAASSAIVARLMRVQANLLHPSEAALQPWIAASAAGFAGLVPFLLLPMHWASPALAIEGTLLLIMAQRWQARWLAAQACAYQALAGVMFAFTLQGGGAGSVLGNGWGGLAAASLIGASMLVGVWTTLRAGGAASGAANTVQFSAVNSIGLLAALAFFNLAPMFVLPWAVALMIWPITGLLTLWWAVRVRHLPAVLFALALQGCAGLAFVVTNVSTNSVAAMSGQAFTNVHFLAPLLLAMAALFCARLLQRDAARVGAPAGPDSASAKLPKQLAAGNLMGWMGLVWSGTWWAVAWCAELGRLLLSTQLVPALIGITVASGLFAALLARRLQWAELHQATLVFVPVLTLLAAWQWALSASHPSSGWGALAWPVALGAHLWLLQRQSACVGRRLLGLAHTLGAWLFVVLAALELRWQFSLLGNATSAWALLGWMIAPVAYLWWVTRRSMQSRWPLRDFSEAYLLHASAPMVIYLLGWIWLGNILSDGSAAPLPYLPLLNPLELAQCAALIGVVGWIACLRYRGAGVHLTVGASALAILTGMVARSCHHYANVAWQVDALFASNLVQTALSITWSVVAIGLMLIGHRRIVRWVWVVGALLMAVVVGKLFLVELAATGSLARIVSFIVVGVLLLVVGYFAPLPPKATPTHLREAV